MQTENTDNLIHYCSTYQQKQITVKTSAFGDLVVNVPVNTKWLIIEGRSAFVSSDTIRPQFEAGFENIHNGDWVDHPRYRCFDKHYIGWIDNNTAMTELIEC